MVDAIGFNDKTEVHGFMHTTDLHVVERFKRLDNGSLQYDVTIEDPNVFASPWVIPARTFALRPEAEWVDEFVCESNVDYNKIVQAVALTGRSGDRLRISAVQEIRSLSPDLRPGIPLTAEGLRHNFTATFSLLKGWCMKVRRDLVKRFPFIVLALLFTVLCTQAFGQSNNATVSGTAEDSSKAVLPGVTVTVTNTATGVVLTAVTNESGAYNPPGLLPGPYKITAELPGFQTKTYEVTLGNAQTVRLNFSLNVAGVGTAVEVSVPVDTLLATSSASIGEVLSQEKCKICRSSATTCLCLLNTPRAPHERRWRYWNVRRHVELQRQRPAGRHRRQRFREDICRPAFRRPR